MVYPTRKPTALPRCHAYCVVAAELLLQVSTNCAQLPGIVFPVCGVAFLDGEATYKG